MSEPPNLLIKLPFTPNPNMSEQVNSQTQGISNIKSSGPELNIYSTVRRFITNYSNNFYLIYLLLVSALGLLPAGWGLLQLSSYDPLSIFLLLVALAVVASFATTSATVSDEVGITYGIVDAIAIAAVPFFGIGAAAIILVVDNLALWLLKPTNQTTWKKSWSQLAFNTGLHGISITIAGLALLLLLDILGTGTLWGQLFSWLLASYIYVEVNMWLLIGILRLQYGQSISPRQLWKEDRWATQINVLTMGVGGGILAYSIDRFDWIGVAVFFLPILLSAYAFRLYVRQMQAHLDNLENIVAERTSELAERTDELAELDRQKDAFLAVLTHDMITPLTSIQMYTELIKDDPACAAEDPELVTAMLQSQKTVFELVKNILDLEKLKAGGTISSQKVPCELTEIVANSVEIVRAEALRKDITLVPEPAEASIMITADRHQVQRITLNLIANAVKYTPSGGSIYVSAKTDGESVKIAIRDTGYGISPDDLPLIFDRFRRVGESKDKAVGTGLGLAITKALVEEHDGEIIVTSEVGKGSVFTVVLPA